MPATRPMQVTIGPDAVPQLVEFCRKHQYTKLLMVADRNTYAAQGKVVEQALRGAGFDLKQVVFTDEEVVADAAHVLDVLVEADRQERIFIAVGSGTLTDITRFSSHRTKTSFISVPTAPSVDGFASIGAPLIIHGVKITVICHAPIALFADIDTLAHAPRAMIAAGFADMLGKLTSIADWRIGHLLWNEPYQEPIAERTLAAVKLCTDNAAAIGQASPDAVRILLDALLESGYCMLDFGSSRPASGAEHHYSHYWEMMLLRQGRPAILHGAKVGVATALVAGLYARAARPLAPAGVRPARSLDPAAPRTGRSGHSRRLRRPGRRRHRRARQLPQARRGRPTTRSSTRSSTTGTRSRPSPRRSRRPSRSSPGSRKSAALPPPPSWASPRRKRPWPPPTATTCATASPCVSSPASSPSPHELLNIRAGRRP